MSLLDPLPDEPLDTSNIDFNDYWAIDADGLAWTFILKRMCRGVPEGALDWMLGLKPNGELRWFLNKKKFPAEVVAKALGADVTKLATAKTITLSALERRDPPNQPLPNVPYYGEA